MTVTPRRSRTSKASSRTHSTWRAYVWSATWAGLSDRPIRPGQARSRAGPRRDRTGIIVRYRNDQDGSPCSSSTGSPLVGPSSTQASPDPVHVAIAAADNRSQADRRNGPRECAALSCRHAVMSPARPGTQTLPAPEARHSLRGGDVTGPRRGRRTAGSSRSGRCLRRARLRDPGSSRLFRTSGRSHRSGRRRCGRTSGPGRRRLRRARAGCRNQRPSGR